MNLAKTNQKGFSIIEVVLVLAIAGLIFLMVFVALPALQRSQRDTGRRNDVGVVISAIGSYASNNNGKLPPNATELRKYVPALSQYDATKELVLSAGIGGKTSLSTIIVNTGAKCVDGGAVVKGTSRQSAVRVQLEGSSGAIYCQNA